MEPKTALVSGLILASILIIWYGFLLWTYTILGQLGSPEPAYIVVFGILMLVFVVIGTKVLVKE
jgi:hypothetical protein